MCSITVKLSEYVLGLKSIFGQQWHFKSAKKCTLFSPDKPPSRSKALLSGSPSLRKPQQAPSSRHAFLAISGTL
jgi:hypothetical protein